jgi:hypothetical protein
MGMARLIFRFFTEANANRVFLISAKKHPYLKAAWSREKNI